MIAEIDWDADKCAGITSDPNRADGPDSIVRRVGQIVPVNLETVRIVNRLPEELGEPRGRQLRR